MTQRFGGRVAIITGSSRGIGFSVAQSIVAGGGRVCLTGRSVDSLQSAVERLGGGSVAIYAAGKADDVDHQREAVAQTLNSFGAIDYLVNAAGINPAYGSLMDIELGAARKTFEVNSLAPLAWTQQVHRAWMSSHGGSIVNVSSLAGATVAPMLGFYGGTKAMLMHMTRQLASELSPSVRVNAIAPAVIKTDFAAKLYEAGEEETAARFPLKRLGEPRDASDLVTFLLSDAASWITGQVITLDGGLALTGGS
jgi:NAD(P)-dependent dehydrogenase (short-subunit alcohol dehydrogenase family)